MDEKITIIEGPPPVFEAVNDGWALGLNEGSRLSVPALTRLRTYNGPALVERCYRAWNSQSPIHLHYRNDMGVEQAAPILAAVALISAFGLNLRANSWILPKFCTTGHASAMDKAIAVIKTIKTFRKVWPAEGLCLFAFSSETSH